MTIEFVREDAEMGSARGGPSPAPGSPDITCLLTT